MIARAERLLHHLARGVAYVSGGLVLIAAGLTLYEVFMRSVLNRPFFGANDLVLYLLTLGVIGFFPLMVDSGHHIKIDSLGKMAGLRWNRLIEWFAASVTLVVLAAFAWQFWRQGMRLAAYNDATQILHIPTAPLWLAASAIMGLATAIQALAVLTGHLDRIPVHQTLSKEH
jgi:TRAP-type transport system small permease protein